MKKIIKRLIFSNIEESHKEDQVISYQIKRLKQLWNNDLEETDSSIGIERILMLTLILIQLLFLGFYIRALFGKLGTLWKTIGVEIYVIFKLISAIVILKYQLFNFLLLPNGKSVFFYWIIYMIVETLIYTANLIFCDKVFSKPFSNKRNVILLFFDYIELVVDFASLYIINSSLQFANSHKQIVTSLDALYFSFVSSMTIGFGDIVVKNDFGKTIVILQSVVFLVFVVLFINFYTSKITTGPSGRGK